MIRPNEYHKAFVDIDFLKLKKEGINLLCIDLDNTLDYPDLESKNVIEEIDTKLKEVENLNFDIVIFSNNTEERVKTFIDIKGYKYIHSARKPFQKNYKHGYIKKYNKKEVCFIGDKIVTDIIGGNMYGSRTILVDPLTNKKKYWYTKIMNTIEDLFRIITGFKKGDYFE